MKQIILLVNLTLYICQLGSSPQPLIINGGNMPAVHVYHPIKRLPTRVQNTLEEYQAIEDLTKLSNILDNQIKDYQNKDKEAKQILSGINYKFKQVSCSDLQSPMRVRLSNDQKEEVEQVYGELKNKIIKYYKDDVYILLFFKLIIQLNSNLLEINYETNLINSFDLEQFQLPVIVENFNNCLQLQNKSNQDINVVCVENEQSAKNWIETITQNLKNCHE